MCWNNASEDRVEDRYDVEQELICLVLCTFLLIRKGTIKLSLVKKMIKCAIENSRRHGS